MANSETIEETAIRFLQSVQPGEVASLQGLSFLAAYIAMSRSLDPVASAMGSREFVKLLRALQEHPDPKSVPEKAWLVSRLGEGPAELALPHWPFLISVLRPSFDSFLESPDSSRDEAAFREWGTVQSAADHGPRSEEILLPIARKMFGREQGQLALDEVRRKRDNPTSRHPSAFYRPVGDIAKGIRYVKRALVGHRIDARNSQRYPEFPPSTLRRHRLDYNEQLSGKRPRDEELFPLLDAYFSGSNDVDDEFVSDRAFVASKIRDVTEARRAHHEPDTGGLLEIAKLVLLRRGEEGKVPPALKESVRREVKRLREHGMLPPKPAKAGRETFTRAQLMLVVESLTKK